MRNADKDGGNAPAAAMPLTAGSRPARLAVPDGATDCHIHVYDPRFPYDPAAQLCPGPATVEDYRRLQARLGTSRCVVVQPSSYGTDNACLLDALGRLGPAARGVAVVDAAVTDGTLRALGVTGLARAPELPDAPPVADTLPGFETGTWVGLFAPAGTPAAIVARVDEATRKVLSAEATRARLAELGMQPLLADPQAFAGYLRQEIDKWVGVVRRAGITAE
ncbi:tripartite tricarboxylate transporter substrate-binding protein [Muricoccus pecuniae]|uniref:Tripartite tricarboxylate transporter family receptor n=1 Tax=Muricoccus pecuniae TaxID=693023 RepID=A0A840YE03_9PROT|nr:tripartite tricarboxylate transporter substrate-binding protein [Roseomonas pecuniae]MBB5692732.1 hypothetical protein [Roseomonas pecuniae]